MNISIIIPNLNGEKLLKKNLPKVFDAVKDYRDGKMEIIIPDDGSEDDSAGVIENFFAEINKAGVIGKTTENNKRKERGFSKNVGRGVQLATGDVLILLNTDVAPRKDFLRDLLKHFEDPEVFAVGCMDESLEDGKAVLRGRGLGSFKRGFLIHRKGEVGKSNTLWVSCGSGAFRREIWDKLKGLDVLYNPFYWEDIDMSYRALKSGYKIVFEPKSIVAHAHDEGVIKSKYDDSFVKQIAYRNQFIFMWKNITDPSIIASHILWLPYHLIKALSKGDSAFFSGFYLALTRFGRIISSRKASKKYFIKKDVDVIAQYIN